MSTRNLEPAFRLGRLLNTKDALLAVFRDGLRKIGLSDAENSEMQSTVKENLLRKKNIKKDLYIYAYMCILFHPFPLNYPFLMDTHTHTHTYMCMLLRV